MTDQSLPETADVVIVGGGVSGVAAARNLAVDHDVVVVEKGQLAAEASALAAGIIGLSTTYADYPAIADHAASFFDDYDGTGEFKYTQRGSLKLVPPAHEDASRKEAAKYAERDFGVTWLDSAELAERYPAIHADSFVGAVEYASRPGKGWLDPYTLATTLADDAVERGAHLETDCAVDEVLVEDGVVRGVETEGGTVEADAVVVAAGWWTPRLLDDVIALPIRPYRTQCLVLDPGEGVSDFTMGFVPGEHVYFRPETNGDLLVGGWSFATDEPDGASRFEDEEFRQHVADLIPQIFEGWDNAEFVNGWAGVDAATPDTKPIIDAPSDAPDGLVIATGFHGRGVMTSPVTGTAVGALVRGEAPPFPMEPFRLDRFESRSADFEFDSISDGAKAEATEEV